MMMAMIQSFSFVSFLPTDTQKVEHRGKKVLSNYKNFLSENSSNLQLLRATTSGRSQWCYISTRSLTHRSLSLFQNPLSLSSPFLIHQHIPAHLPILLSLLSCHSLLILPFYRSFIIFNHHPSYTVSSFSDHSRAPCSSFDWEKKVTQDKIQCESSSSTIEQEWSVRWRIEKGLGIDPSSVVSNLLEIEF